MRKTHVIGITFMPGVLRVYVHVPGFVRPFYSISVSSHHTLLRLFSLYDGGNRGFIFLVATQN